VGLYCEQQDEEHCGAHALNALLGRAVLSRATTYMVKALSSSMEKARRLAEVSTELFKRQGQYDLRAINTWLYEHTNGQYMLLPFLSVGQPGNRSKSQVLNAAPAGCRAIYIQYIYETGGKRIEHYKAWMQGTPAPATAGNNTQQHAWYECESIAYSNFGMIRQLTDHDWNSFTENMMCLVSADAYATAYGISPPSMHPSKLPLATA
jgi:hypothetical protein